MAGRWGMLGLAVGMAACSGGSPASNPDGGDAGGGDAAGDAPTHQLDIDPKGAVLVIDTAPNSVTPVSQGYTSKLDGIDATATTSFALADSGYGSFSGPAFTSATTLPGLAIAGTTHVLATNSGAQATTSLTLIALKATGTAADPYAVLPYLGAASSLTTVVRFAPNLGSPSTQADIQCALTNDAANGSVDATALVASVAAMAQGDTNLGCAASPAKDTNADTVLDTFTSVISGAPVCFQITFKNNTTIAAKASVQVLQLVGTAIAQPGAKNVETRQIYVFVPPTP